MKNINNLSKKQDRELVVLLMGGSQEAFGELYARYRKPLMYSCKKYVKDEAESEDIVHDVFLQLWETRHLINPELSFAGYLQKMVHNSIMYKFRQSDIHSRFTQHVLMNAKDSSNETEDTVIENDYATFLNELIENLPPKQKEIFRLNLIKGLKYNEIAELLQMPTENVRKNVSLALKKVKKQVSENTDINFQTVIFIFILLELVF